ncbi:HEAT repeat domain-containing protein [Halorhabdus amylolytica]|uniref:HEAT repeat domain-containing protein n=1 Tax=Halorhabdus amylolytica TaxID=2559573 RepID=UPI0010AB4510|nr:HEAT repeat domain-containing protein [Halorhabdus amylolytica]
MDETTAAQASTDTATATESPPEDEELSETDPSEERSSGADQPKNEREAASLEARLTDLENDDLTAAEIRELGDDLQSDGVPDQAFTLLERHAAADDAEIRLAVCEVCAEIDDERADEILRGRRIDTDDRVMNAAINGLR